MSCHQRIALKPIPPIVLQDGRGPEQLSRKKPASSIRIIP
jgi:hypothetical protein